MTTARDVVAQRLAVQRVTGEPFAGVPDAVRSLLAVQAQDLPLSRFSLALRTSRRPIHCDEQIQDEQIQAALSTGDVVRTHVLRPTWHYVHRDDLRWLLALTAPRTVSSMAARHRQLGIDAGVEKRAFAALDDMLRGGTYQTRSQLAPGLPTTTYPRQGEVVGHLLMLAELAGLICSGPLRAGEHTYALVDEVVPAATTPERSRGEAVSELVTRFLAGHGPASMADLKRWWPGAKSSELTLALSQHERVVIDGVELFSAVPMTVNELPDAVLLPTFDEAFLPFGQVSFRRGADHPLGAMRLNAGAAGGGHVIVGDRNRGVWKRTLARGRLVVKLNLESGVTAAERTAIETAAEQLRTFHDADHLVVSSD